MKKFNMEQEKKNEIDDVEENVASVNMGNVSGMGAVTTPVSSGIPGDSTGGQEGSGDTGATPSGKRKKKKSNESKILSFEEWLEMNN